MAERNGVNNATRSIQTLTKELERLGDNPMLDWEASQERHKAIWEEINALRTFLNETKAVRKAPANTGRNKHAQRSLAV